MSSITPGPMRWNGRAAIIIPSCNAAVPFTPVTGRRLLGAGEQRRALLEAGKTVVGS